MTTQSIALFDVSTKENKLSGLALVTILFTWLALYIACHVSSSSTGTNLVGLLAFATCVLTDHLFKLTQKVSVRWVIEMAACGALAFLFAVGTAVVLAFHQGW